MLKIRMQRTGRINVPSYRIVVLESARSTKSGKIVERLGSYNPKSKERILNTERIKYWLSVGAKPTDTMHNMLVSEGVINAKKINVLPKYQTPAPEPVAETPAPAAEAPAAEAPASEATTEAPATPAEESAPATE